MSATMAYYFLAASLPTLSLEESPPITGAEFLRACEDNVSRRDHEDLRHIVEGEPDKAVHPFVRDWLCRETLLRNEIAIARAARLGVEADPFLRYCEFYEPYTAAAVAEIMGGREDSRVVGPSPRDREMAFDRFRWAVLDEMTVFTPFGIEAIFAFALKLGMALGWARLDAKKGQNALDGFLKKAFVSQ